MTTVLQSLSTELAEAVESAGRAVVAIHARRRIPATGRIAQRAAVYPVMPGTAKNAATDETLTMWPRLRRIMSGRNALVRLNAPRYGTAIICAASAGLVSRANRG